MNSDKCHLTLSSNDRNEKIELNGEVINNTQVRKLRGAHIDYKLKFDTHIEILYKKVGKKTSFLCPSYKVHVYKANITIMEKSYNVAIKILSTHLDVS